MLKTCVNALLILLGIGITSIASALWWDSVKPDNMTVPSLRDFSTSTVNIPNSLVSATQDKLGKIKESLKNKDKSAVTKA